MSDCLIHILEFLNAIVRYLMSETQVEALDSAGFMYSFILFYCLTKILYNSVSSSLL